MKWWIVWCVVSIQAEQLYDTDIAWSAFREFQQQTKLPAYYQRGCIVDIDPFTVVLELKMENNTDVRVHMTRPWRSSSWIRRESEVVYDRVCNNSLNAEQNTTRVDIIVNAIRHAWASYYTFASTMDTLQPLTKSGTNNFGGIRITALDALDTLWIAGLLTEFEQATELVNKITFNISSTVNVFETTIRALGGLLSAHLLTDITVFIDKAQELGERLLPAFQHGLPKSDIQLSSGHTSDPPWQSSSLSEIALTLEFKHLSTVTQNPRFYDAVDHVDAHIRDTNRTILPHQVHIGEDDTLSFHGNLRLGARADSYYEYLYKEWQRSGNILYWNAFVKAVDSIEKQLYVQSADAIFVGERESENSSYFSSQMDHLVCFWPGVLALASKETPKWLHDAKRLMNTCCAMHTEPHILAPEITSYAHDIGLYIKPADRHNLLRPETLESLYHLWYVTKDDSYCEMSWRIFEHMERAAFVKYGYASIRDVTSPIVDHIDEMPSYFLAETLKYALLCAAKLRFPDYILTTEGHFVKKA